MATCSHTGDHGVRGIVELIVKAPVQGISPGAARGPRRSLASKYSVFTVLLLAWVAGVVVWWDIRQHTFDWTMGGVLLVVVAATAMVISRITTRLLARPPRADPGQPHRRRDRVPGR